MNIIVINILETLCFVISVFFILYLFSISAQQFSLPIITKVKSISSVLLAILYLITSVFYVILLVYIHEHRDLSIVVRNRVLYYYPEFYIIGIIICVVVISINISSCLGLFFKFKLSLINNISIGVLLGIISTTTIAKYFKWYLWGPEILIISLMLFLIIIAFNFIKRNNSIKVTFLKSFSILMGQSLFYLTVYITPALIRF